MLVQVMKLNLDCWTDQSLDEKMNKWIYSEWFDEWIKDWSEAEAQDLIDHPANFWFVVERHSFADWLVCKKKSCSTSRQGNWLTSQEITRTRMVTFRNKISYISWRLLLLFQPNTGEALRQLLFNVDQIRLQLLNETHKFMDIVGTNCFHFKFGNLIALRLLD